MIEKIKNLIRKMNEAGIPLPLVRVDGKPSLSATLVFISFNAWLISVVGKFAGFFGGVDSGQCLQMFLATAGLYWGRKFQSGNSSLETEKKEDK